MRETKRRSRTPTRHRPTTRIRGPQRPRPFFFPRVCANMCPAPASRPPFPRASRRAFCTPISLSLLRFSRTDLRRAFYRFLPISSRSRPRPRQADAMISLRNVPRSLQHECLYARVRTELENVDDGELFTSARRSSQSRDNHAISRANGSEGLVQKVRSSA